MAQQTIPFGGQTAYRLIRAEYGVALGICVVLFVAHFDSVRVVPAIVAFVAIDLFGYLPGLLAHRRGGGGAIPRPYYVLYNATHSFLTHAVILGAWGLLFGFEWAMLAVPIHLCGDRALFGNFLKSFADPFEPTPMHRVPDASQARATELVP